MTASEPGWRERRGQNAPASLAAARRAAAAFGLFLFLLSFHGFNAYSDDEVTYIWMAHSAADRGTFAMPPSYPFFSEHLVTTPRGERYGPYPPGWPAFLAPFSGAARMAATAIGGTQGERNLIRFRFLTLVAPLLGVLLVATLARLFEECGTGGQKSWIYALLLFFGSPGWFYARTLHSENLRTLLLLLSLLAAIRQGRGGAFLAGLAVGAACLVRIDSPLAIPVLLLLLGRSPRPLPRAAIFLLPVTGFFGVAALYNFIRYGQPLGIREYGALFVPGKYLESLLVYLFSPGRGFLVYAPVGFLGLFTFSRLRVPLERGLFLLGSAFLLLAGFFQNWIWVWDWGPRYFHLTWYAWGVLAILHFRDRPRRLLAAALSWGFVVNALAVPAEFVVHYNTVGETGRIVLDPRVWPPLGQIESIRRGAWDLPLWSGATWPLGLLLAAAGAGLLGAVLRGRAE